MTSPTDTRTRSRTIPAIATTDEALSASAALVAAAAAAEIGLIIGCHKHYVRLGFINKKGGQYYIYKSTFVKASDALDASYKEFSSVRDKRIPSPLAKILIPFSFAETAKRVPSLLKRIRGLA